MSRIERTIAPPAESWVRSQYRRAAIPGWCLSLVIHAGFLFLVSTSLKSCGGVMTGEMEGEYRQVGLIAAELSNGEETADATADAEAESVVPSEAVELPEVPQQPPTELIVPDPSSDTFGPGSIAPPTAFPSPSSDLLQPAPRTIPLPSAFGQGDGSVRFLGAADKGTTFVYVIDCSGSMGDYKALDFAKAELLASLQGLTPAQKFQVIFYNERLNVMSLDGGRETTMYPATDANRNRAKRFILGVPPSLGTRHLPALQRAMALEPDVIFLLTDAKDPALSAADLETVKQANRGQARIHCIEFGIGNHLGPETFLARLARQNGGTHSYHDVRRLSDGL